MITEIFSSFYGKDLVLGAYIKKYNTHVHKVQYTCALKSTFNNSLGELSQLNDVFI